MHGCRCRLNKGGILFGRTRYQEGSLRLEERSEALPYGFTDGGRKTPKGNQFAGKLSLGTWKSTQTSQGRSRQQRLFA